ncbi:MAG: Cj0069 family protein [Acidimicrobiales bacterium]
MTEVGSPIDAGARIGLLWRGTQEDPDPNGRGAAMLGPFSVALSDLGAQPEAVSYCEEETEAVRKALLGLDGVVVWVNPIQADRDRSGLDDLLREVADAGVWVSAHPDVILAMGTKEVLYRTRELSWSTDTHLYRDRDQLAAQLPEQLATGPRVLKQYRGTGGNGVWKVEAASPGPVGLDSMVRVDHALQWTGTPKAMALSSFLERCDAYFAGSGRVIDQAYVERLGEGMIRCYLIQNQVAGFAHQWPRGLLPRTADGQAEPAPPTTGMQDASAYQGLRAQMESEWVPAMLEVLGLDAASLPVIWDADFLYGPKKASGEDTYVLCEINVSAVWPYPTVASEEMARVTLDRVRAHRGRIR